MVGLITAAVALYLFVGNAADDDIPQPELEEIARTGFDKNIHGVAGDELVGFIVSESITQQPDLLGKFLKDRLQPGTTWRGGPIVNVTEARYEVTATAYVRVHHIMPVAFVNGVSVEVQPIGPDDIDAIRLYNAISAAGLNAICREWMGDVSRD